MRFVRYMRWREMREVPINIGFLALQKIGNRISKPPPSATRPPLRAFVFNGLVQSLGRTNVNVATRLPPIDPKG
jgi:hypothetical protein